MQALIRQLNQKKDTLLEVAGFQVPQHTWEQTVWRRTQVKEKSPDCWTQGACTVCGCEILGRTLEDRPCEGSCYPAMMDAPTWSLFKKFHDIKLFD